MKRNAFLLLSLLLAMAVIGQEPAPSIAAPVVKNRNMAIGFNAGYAMVLGSYGKFDREYSKSGYASGGWLMQFSFDWMGQRNFGLVVQYTFMHNPLLDTAAQVIPPGPYKYPIGEGSWNNHFLMAGPGFMKAFGRLHLDVKFLFGGVVSASPVFNMTDPTSGENVKDVGMGIAIQASGGVGYLLTPRIVLKGNIGYLAGWPSKSKSYGAQLLGYQEIVDPITGNVIGYEPVYSAPAEYEIKKVISVLSPSAGIVFKF